MQRRLFLAIAAFSALAASGSPVAAQSGGGAGDKVINDPRVPALIPYGLNLPPQVRDDKSVQFGKAMRIPLSGHADFGRIGVITPTLKPVKKGDRIVIAFWAKATDTRDGAPGRIGRVQLEETPVVRTLFEKPFEIGPEWKMYQLAGTVERDYAPRQLNAALHIDAAKQVLHLGPVFVLNYGQGGQ